MCFDTNNKINPDWYGKIYASGGGTLRGRPGVVSMMLDVSTTANSDFTFVLSETQTASDYEFLTFSDRRKTELEEISGTVDPEEQFKKSLPKPESDRPSLFSMDIRCSVTPAARMTLVMDPKAGDRIVARGGGPMQISYNRCRFMGNTLLRRVTIISVYRILYCVISRFIREVTSHSTEIRCRVCSI